MCVGEFGEREGGLGERQTERFENSDDVFFFEGTHTLTSSSPVNKGKNVIAKILCRVWQDTRK
jgi:hypothetical protein